LDYIVQSQHNQKCPLIRKDISFLKGGQFAPAETGYFIRRVHHNDDVEDQQTDRIHRAHHKPDNIPLPVCLAIFLKPRIV